MKFNRKINILKLLFGIKIGVGMSNQGPLAYGIN